MEWDFPVYNIHKIIGQRIRNFVANGNMMVITGGILGIEFINSYFFYNIELAGEILISQCHRDFA